MKDLICPRCRNISGVPDGAHGVHTHNCVHCKESYGVMYIAGFNDGMSSKKKKKPPVNNTQQLKSEIRTIIFNSRAMSTVEFYSYIDNNFERLLELSS